MATIAYGSTSSSKTIRSGRFLQGFVLLLTLFGSIQLAYAGTCYLDDPLESNPLTSPIQCGGVGDDFSGDDLCGHTVHGSSCVLEVNRDSDGVDFVNCLTVGEGVTVEFNDHTIDCDTVTDRCGGFAIHVTGSGTTSSKRVRLKNGNITGCWQYAINPAAAGKDAQVSDFIIDKGPDTCGSGGGSYAITGVAKVTRTAVKGYTEWCIGRVDDIVDSLVADCGDVGILGDQDTTIDNTVVINNDVNIKMDHPTTGNITLKNSTVYGAGTCNLDDQGTCDDPLGENVVDLTGALNIIDCAIIE